jgi:hypothetical protein
MRMRVSEFEHKVMARWLSKKLNTAEQKLGQRRRAKKHWLDSVKLAAGIDLSKRPSSAGRRSPNKPVDMAQLATLVEAAQAAVEMAREMPIATEETVAAWKKTSDLFISCFEVLGRERDAVLSEISAERAAASGMTLAKMRWKSACTMVSTMLQIDRRNAEIVTRCVEALLETYGACEGAVTGMLTALTQDVKGELIGLEYRLKGQASLFRKIMSDLDQEREAESARPVQEVCANIFDVLRFTAVLDTKNYVDGVRHVIKELDGKRLSTRLGSPRSGAEPQEVSLSTRTRSSSTTTTTTNAQSLS